MRIPDVGVEVDGDADGAAFVVAGAVVRGAAAVGLLLLRDPPADVQPATASKPAASSVTVRTAMSPRAMTADPTPRRPSTRRAPGPPHSTAHDARCIEISGDALARNLDVGHLGPVLWFPKTIDWVGVTPCDEWQTYIASDSDLGTCLHQRQELETISSVGPRKSASTAQRGRKQTRPLTPR